MRNDTPGKPPNAAAIVTALEREGRILEPAERLAATPQMRTPDEVSVEASAVD